MASLEAPLPLPTTPQRTAAVSDIPNLCSTGASTVSPQSIGDKGPVALATTKRKFQRLLDNITSTASRTKYVSRDPHESTAKRIRLEARSRLAASGTGLRQDANTTFIQTQLLTSRLAAATSSSRRFTDTTTRSPADKVSQEPNYLPWSHDQFLRRLKTFADVRLWTPKPEPVNEVQWAKQGWVCAGWNTVACKGGCEQRIVVGLRPSRKDADGNVIEDSEDYSVDIDGKLVGRYVDFIKTGHEESCLWREAGCKDDIFRLPIAKPSIWQSQLQERYHSFNAMPAHLPPLDRLTLPLDPSEIAPQFPPSFFVVPVPDNCSENEQPVEGNTQRPPPLSSDPSAITNPDANPNSNPQPINTTALSFALLGWTGTSFPALATCPACFRRLGLWLYPNTSAINPNSSANDNPDNDNDTLPRLDLISNHRDYCPWINAASQQMPGSFAGLAAWEILVRLIAQNAPAGTAGSRSSTSMNRDIDAEALDRDRRVTAASIRRVSGSTVGDLPATGGGMTVQDTNAVDTTNEEGQEGDTDPSLTTPKKKDAKQVEKEDKARFARLKELTKLMGLRGRKAKAKPA